MAAFIVTGAASGIGRATAELLLDKGIPVVGVDLDRDGLRWLADREDAAAVGGDATAEETAAGAAERATTRFGGIAGAVLNAGRTGSWPLESGTLADFDDVLNTNVRSVLVALRAYVPVMRAGGGGAVVVTASVSGLGGEPVRWPYTVSKAAVINLVQSLSLDLAPDNIRINAVCPGPIHTGLTSRLKESYPGRYDRLRDAAPMKRWGEAREVAEVIAFLASPAASYVTGVAVPVDGGYSAGSGQATALSGVTLA